MKKEIIINKKAYQMPEMSPLVYMDYLAIRDEVMDTEGKQGLYTRGQFVKILDIICKVYGNQFTREELLTGGLTVPQIITEFATIELGVQDGVEKQVSKLQANFTNGK